MVAQSRPDLTNGNGESTEQHDLRATMLQPSGDLRMATLERFVRSPRINSSNPAGLAKILLNAECWLSDIVGLRNARLTKAFLMEKDAAASNMAAACPAVTLSRNARLKAAFGDVEARSIDADSRASVDRVLSSLDVPNAEAILKYGPDKAARTKYLIERLVRMATTRGSSETLRVFVKQLVELRLLDEDALELIELQVFAGACGEVVQIFLECRVEVLMEKSLGRNPLTTLFGNPKLSLGFLRDLDIEANARGREGFTALHFAVQSGLVSKVRFLLDCGADVDAFSAAGETPLTLTLREPRCGSADNERCAELLLQHGANPFLRTLRGESFASCVHSEDASLRCLMELALAYVRIYKSTANWASVNADILISVEATARQSDELRDFYVRCEEQIRSLKKDSVRRDLTMFDVVSNTGHELIRLINEKDRRVIASFVDKYVDEGTFHPQYINALQEHMRQYRKLVTCQYKATLAISERLPKSVPPRKVLAKVKREFSAKFLLRLQ